LASRGERQPGLDKSAVAFQVGSEGQRGLLGVGYAPARVVARVEADALAPPPELRDDESALAAHVRELLERIAFEIAGRARIELAESDEALVATIYGADLGLLIGKHGQTIDAIQYLVNAIVYRDQPERTR